MSTNPFLGSRQMIYQASFIALILALAPVFLTTQSFKENIDAVYDFSPSSLGKSEQEKKMPALDAFWSKIKADTNT